MLVAKMGKNAQGSRESADQVTSEDGGGELGREEVVGHDDDLDREGPDTANDQLKEMSASRENEGANGREDAREQCQRQRYRSLPLSNTDRRR
jgi:hypothetical protein